MKVHNVFSDGICYKLAILGPQIQGKKLIPVSLMITSAPVLHVATRNSADKSKTRKCCEFPTACSNDQYLLQNLKHCIIHPTHIHLTLSYAKRPQVSRFSSHHGGFICSVQFLQQHVFQSPFGGSEGRPALISAGGQARRRKLNQPNGLCVEPKWLLATAG